MLPGGAWGRRIALTVGLLALVVAGSMKAELLLPLLQDIFSTTG